MKRIIAVNSSGSQEVLATLEMRPDGTLNACWFDDRLRADLDYIGFHYRGRTLRPSDGKTFYDFIDYAYAQSSRMFVQSE